ncbi:tRNA uridine-5-carboxymethylaminomethyl(34) synthesis GTPase MnmE [Leptospira congkakensis]|uniref:tRNA modification GTPase MnmE n=1 Tax=Leptospira congkakensis TaxID=2484932 RepID=A0A4Z0ZZJ4_9LEPT|nr:tRNA uridine-5-carboxymethylaminomethyl(34) synthesis GTPase MnmE [Leptospira congkakensis]TGL86330.1 tRNA uridine-5-carboxymethylaminomethyl(34) synthesis GTPase MnmE [Leptospira congkakensis]TGL94125.1 tRNA uridine-5-carboxymethylaminomethyl(34) synthesis GTPase MnmE [Leptospira congkakensis]TGL94467.1 tRNA uridine-5-carboxymethylaminomethyl(34) synthesis GTPase MnmE [Leptospira congkakensis]
MIDTIAALSTASGPGAIGILRVSGSAVLPIALAVLQKNGSPLTEEFISNQKRTAIFCDFIDSEKPLDQIVFFYFPAPNSYTGEDLAEFHLHGNPILLKRALQILFEKGARPAQKGEFTKRAYLNGKINLSGAEAIGRLIEARSRYELELAQKNVFGEITKLSSKIRSDLISLKAECEAEIDFSTEDLTFESLEERKNRMISLKNLCSKLIKDSERAETLILQSTVVLFGEPNTGKSSLMNLLIGKDRSIISDIPGTTRDYIAEELSLDGIPIRLVDTAGIRDTSDNIEQMGIERSKREADSANVKLLLIDTSIPFDKTLFLEKHKERLRGAILVANKIDDQNKDWNRNQLDELQNEFELEITEISCKTKIGIPHLLELLKTKLTSQDNSEDVVLLEDRQRYHIQKIESSLSEAIRLMEDNAPAEIYIQEINTSLKEIGEVNGHVDNEEILGRIFSKFCVGK